MDTPNFYFALREDLQDLCATHGSEQNLKPEHFMPSKAHAEDTGYDVRCAAPGGISLLPGCYFKIPLGFRVFAPQGWWLELRPRSSTFVKHHIQALYGVIDETYENEMVFAGKYDPDACQLLSVNGEKSIAFGEKIGQLLPVRRMEMTCSQISSEEYKKMCGARKSTRGESGFGGSGRF